jgi:hypothetical protein
MPFRSSSTKSYGILNEYYYYTTHNNLNISHLVIREDAEDAVQLNIIFSFHNNLTKLK